MEALSIEFVREKTFFVHPRFIDEENVVVLKRRNDGTISLNIMNLLSGETERLITPSFSVAGYPSVYDSTIYFTAAYEGNDDLYAYRLKDKKTFKLTTEQTGNYYATVNGDSIAWSQFKAGGLALKSNALSKMQWQEVTPPAKGEVFISGCQCR